MADLNAIIAALIPQITDTGLAGVADRRAKLADIDGLYLSSLRAQGNSLLGLARDDAGKSLLQISTREADLDKELAGETTQIDNFYVRQAALNHANAQWLRDRQSWTAPISLRDRQTTIGFGDRLGRATSGHLKAGSRYAIGPVLAQQSIRELALTKRNYEGVVDDASFLVYQSGYDHGYGADGDHLKTMKDINIALDAGMAMITLDQTEVMNALAETFTPEEVESGFSALPSDIQAHVTATYADRTETFEGQDVKLTALEAKRCTLMYWEALEFTAEVHAHLVKRRGRAFDLELSIDETTAPTLPSHHWFIIAELQRRGVEVTSLAPRFIGDFQKGIDYIGDLNEFEQQFAVHCAIARAHGDYKISVHSGSDKFSAFPIVGKHTRQRFHLKTAGTSWLEATRVISEQEPALFRQMVAASYAGLDEALKLYHITADFDVIPKVDTLPDADLPQLLEINESRQLLHISYGTLLNHPDLRAPFFAAMHRHEAAYEAALDKHFTRHFETLGVAAWGV